MAFQTSRRAVLRGALRLLDRTKCGDVVPDEPLIAIVTNQAPDWPATGRMLLGESEHAAASARCLADGH